jgi:predicted unusual protein kinase regulating ubiquinone biosynthesis (AarF/ABC1/UbiB family)
LVADLAQTTFDYPLRIPPYFALIIRAIGVLEGITLVGDPEFAIVDEAYPYIAQVSILTFDLTSCHPHGFLCFEMILF